jgi:hypothetical protein
VSVQLGLPLLALVAGLPLPPSRVARLEFVYAVIVALAASVDPFITVPLTVVLDASVNVF